jgi:hypothetical protein
MMKTLLLKSMMNKKRDTTLLLATLTLLLVVLQLALAMRSAISDEAEVRGVVQMVFEHLKSEQYDELYDTLPAASRARITRERFTNALRRTSGVYHLDRLEIGAVRVSGDFALVETVMYGSVSRPIEAEGKIVAQQYLVREDGQWRVATGDRATVQRFLAANPKFAKRFPIRQPQVFVKRDGQWVDMTNALKTARRGAAQ